MSETHERGTYNRCQPLLERINVPCEHIIYSEKTGSANKVLSKNVECFTLRILQGHRQVAGATQTTERSIRLELSDENKRGNPRNECEEEEIRSDTGSEDIVRADR